MSDYRPYPAYQDSGVERLGEVPEHWKVSAVKWAFESRLGKMLQPNQLNWQDVEVPYYKAASVQWEYIDAKIHDTMWASQEEIEKYRIIEGDLLICEGGDVGRAGLFKGSELNNAIIQNSVHRVRPKSGNSNELLLRVMQAVRYAGWFDVLCNKATITHFTSEKFGDLAIPVPPVSEQLLIVDFLERETIRIDSLIAKKTRFIELLREKRQALITQAVTQGLDPAAKRKDSGVEWLGEVPKHWEVTPLKWRATVQAGVALGKPVESSRRITLPYLRVANVQDGYLDLTEVKEMELDSRELDRFLLQKGDLLMNEGGDNNKLGRGAVWQAEIAPCIHQNHVFAVRPAAHYVCPEWLGLFTQSDGAKFYFQSRAKQTTNLASISSSSIKEFFVLVPPLNEQRQIIAEAKLFCSRLDSLITKTQQSLGLLKERRAALITAAVTGQIDLRENDAIAAFCGNGRGGSVLRSKDEGIAAFFGCLPGFPDREP